jgi:PPP family 3-phenylpropionic acid transporter
MMNDGYNGCVRKNRLIFLLFFLVFYMTDAASGYFMIYLKRIGYNTLQMALLTSAAALFALCLQPYLGRLADRSPKKNSVLTGAILATAVAAPLLTMEKGFAYILCIYTLFTVMRNLHHPLADTITLEYASRAGISYGPIRAMGCVGYAVMSAIAGKVAAAEPGDTFYLYALSALLTALVLFFVPISRGMQTGRRLNPMLIFKNRILLRYTLFSLVFTMTKSFYHTYFSIYFTSDIGGSEYLYGIMMSFAALTEIPFIFFIDRIIQRIGMKRLLVCAGIIDTLRWLMTAVFTDPQAQLVVHIVLGANNMVMSIAMIIFVNSIMPAETKATGQATYSMINTLGSLLLGNLLGGTLGNYVGIRPVFFICAAANAIVLIPFDISNRCAGKMTLYP